MEENEEENEDVAAKTENADEEVAFRQGRFWAAIRTFLWFWDQLHLAHVNVNTTPYQTYLACHILTQCHVTSWVTNDSHTVALLYLFIPFYQAHSLSKGPSTSTGYRPRKWLKLLLRQAHAWPTTNQVEHTLVLSQSEPTIASIAEPTFATIAEPKLVNFALKVNLASYQLLLGTYPPPLPDDFNTGLITTANMTENVKISLISPPLTSKFLISIYQMVTSAISQWALSVSDLIDSRNVNHHGHGNMIVWKGQLTLITFQTYSTQSESLMFSKW